MQHNGDASVEEILESIKKVIARDNRAGAAEIRNRRERAGMNRAASPAVEAPEMEPADAEEAEEILDLGEADLADDDAEMFGPPAHEAAQAGDDDDAEEFDEPLINAGGSASMRDNFAALAMLAQPGAAPQIVRSGETSLEGLTRELLRPMLAQWLDDNLPPMVEKMVQAEIARIAGKRS